MEGVELGWSSGSLGEEYRHYRVGMWRDDTKNNGSGFGGGLGLEHEFSNGWTPFGRFAFGTSTGSAIKQIEGVGLARVHPFGRRGDFFGVAFNHSQPSSGKHHESIFESFYRLRLTQSVRIGPDIEVSIHPTYATRAYTTTLLGARMEIIF
jgi:porin